MTCDPPPFFPSCVSFLAKKEARAVQISSKSLKMTQLVSSQQNIERVGGNLHLFLFLDTYRKQNLSLPSLQS